MDPHWTELSGQERAKEYLSIGDRLWRDGSGYREQCREALQRYHGAAQVQVTGANGIDDDAPLTWGMTRSMVSTVVSRIGALQAPRAQFVTSDAEWSTRRKASRLDDFFDALALQECPPYVSVHDLRIAIFQDAALMGRGWAAMCGDEEGARVLTERVLPWEIVYDSRDARYGCPREWWRVYPMSRDALISRYGHKSEVEQAPSAPDDTVAQSALDWCGQTTLTQERVQVFECWRVSVGEDPGRHCIGIEGGSGPLLLLDEEWEFDSPPLIGMQWDHPIVGARGLSLADEVRTSENAVNEHLLRMQDVIRRTSISQLLAMRGSVGGDEDTVDASITWYDGQPPQLYAPAPFDASHMQWAQTLWGKAFELTGIGQMAATGERQPGMSSGAAIRASASQQDLRFAWLTRQQGDFIVQWARWGNRLLSKMAANGVDAMARIPGQSSMRTVQFRSLELGEDDYLVQVHPVSEAKNSPAARLEEAEELLQRGLLSPQQYAAARSGSLDTPHWRKWATRQEELIDRYIERWLDATPEDAERIKDNGGYWNEERGIPMVPTPDMWMDVGSASVQVALAYMDAQMESAPDYVLQYMRTFLANCDLVAKKLAEAAGPPPEQVPPTADGAGQGAPPPIPGEMQ